MHAVSPGFRPGLFVGGADGLTRSPRRELGDSGGQQIPLSMPVRVDAMRGQRMPPYGYGLFVSGRPTKPASVAWTSR